MRENTIIHGLLDIFQFKNKYQYSTSNLSSQDMYVLERVYFNQILTIKDLSKKYHIPPSTLTGIIDRLEKKHLINRLRRNSDRRSIEIVATSFGKTLVENHLEEDKIFSSNFFNTLDSNKQETLKSLLEEVLKNIDKDNLFSKNI